MSPAAHLSLDARSAGAYVACVAKLIDSPLKTIRFLPSPGFDLTFARSQRNQVYRSLDGGITWTNEMARILDDEGQEAQGISAIWINPIDSKRMFLVGYGTTHWLTIDGGEKYVPIRTSLHIQSLRWHPRQVDWALASVIASSCYGEAGPMPPSGGEGCNIQLHLTQDAGRTWRQVSSYVIGFSWGMPDAPNYSDTLAFVCGTKDGFRKGNQDFSQWDMNAEVRRTDNLWKSEGTAVPHGTAFLWVERFLFVGLLNPLEPQEIKLKVSRDNGKTFDDALFPFRLSEAGYTVLDTSQGAVFVSVAHSCERDSGNVYLSNSAGNRYSLAIRGVPRNAVGKTDFEKIKSLEGVYVANTFGSGRLGPYFPPEGGQERRRPLRTRISFNKGSFWMKVRPPFVDANGAPYVDSDGTPCESVWKNPENVPEDSECQLQLHMAAEDKYAPIYSHPNATGIVIATGNVGSYLQDRDEQVNTFLSRDGGLTWTEIAKGSHVYEFGDHGSLLVAVPNLVATKTLKYSWDEGKTWRNFDFSDVDVSVDNVVASPHAVESDFVLYGSRGAQGVIVHVDFSTLHMRMCKGVDAPNAPDSDYETWTPGAHDTECVLGHTITYVRRKRDSECDNPETQQRKISRKTCACTEADFECAYGFERDYDQGPCKPLWPVQNNIPIDCPDGSTFFVTNGYQRVAGDTCDINDPSVSNEFRRIHEPFSTQCPTRGGHGWLVFLVVCCVLGAAAAAGAFLYRYRNSDSLGAVKELWSRWEAKLGQASAGRFSRVRYSGLSGAEGAEGLLDDDMDAEASAEPLPEPTSSNATYSFAGGAGRRPGQQAAPTVASLSAAAAAGAGSGPATASPKAQPAGAAAGASSLFDIGDFGQLTAAAAPGPAPPLPPPPRTRPAVAGMSMAPAAAAGPSGPPAPPSPPRTAMPPAGASLLDDDVLGKGSS
eukprot:tig00020614_g12234.t1